MHSNLSSVTIIYSVFSICMLCICCIISGIHGSMNNAVPIVNKYKSDITVRVHTPLNLTCPITVDNNSPMEFMISWTVNGLHETMLALDLRYEFQNNNKILLISNVRPEDAGIYKCKGVTGYGVKEATFYVKTIDEKFCSAAAEKIIENAQIYKHSFKPCFLHQTSTQMKPDSMSGQRYDVDMLSSYRHKIFRNSGESVKLNCSAIGNPSPRYLWRKDSSSVDWIKDISGIRGPILTIDNLRVEYSGHYTCTVSNPIGQISFTYTLIVREYHSETPQILNVLNNVTANSNSSIMLIGTILCSCKPVIQWLKLQPFTTNKSNQPQYLRIPEARITEQNELYSIVDPSNDPRISIETVMKDNGVLVSILRFQRVKETDQGKYVLYSSRGSDGISYRSMFLTVNDPLDTILNNYSGNKSKRLVLYIIIPIFILIFCSAVIFYCCSRSFCCCCPWQHTHIKSLPPSSSGRNIPSHHHSQHHHHNSNSSCLPSQLCLKSSGSAGSTCSRGPGTHLNFPGTPCKSAGNGSNGSSSIVLYPKQSNCNNNNNSSDTSLAYLSSQNQCSKNPSYIQNQEPNCPPNESYLPMIHTDEFSAQSAHTNNPLIYNTQHHTNYTNENSPQHINQYHDIENRHLQQNDLLIYPLPAQTFVQLSSSPSNTYSY